MKKLIALLIAMCMMASLAACGGSQAAPQGQPAESGAATVSTASDDTLVVAIWDNNQLAGLQKIADEWSAKSGMKVQINVISWVEYWTLLEAGASGGELPDVFWMHINEAQKYMRADMLLNLNDYIAADDAIDLANYYEGIVDIYNLDGNQFALPKDHDTIAMIYNKAIFDKYGVAYPDDTWTWDDYAAAAAKIREAGEADGIYGTAMNTNDGQDGWYNLIYGFGGKLISDDNKTSGMDDPKTIEAMTWLADNLFPSMPAQNLMAETDSTHSTQLSSPLITHGHRFLTRMETATASATKASAYLFTTVSAGQQLPRQHIRTKLTASSPLSAPKRARRNRQSSV